MSLLWLEMIKRIAIAMVAIVAVVAAVQAFSLDGVDGWVFARMYGDDTSYAPNFSDAKFRRVTKGMTESEVRALLPAPLGEVWIYNDGANPPANIGFTGDRVDHVDANAHPILKPVRVGATKSDVLQTLGTPKEKTFVYSRSTHDKSYHVRVLKFIGATVSKRISEFYVD